MKEILDIISKSVILGLSTGVFCATSCLPLLVPTLFSRDQKKYGNISVSLIRFLIGRFVAYLMFGLLAGLAGVYLSEYDAFQNFIIPSFYFIIGVLMIAYGIAGIYKHYASCRKINRKFQNPNYLFVLGFLMGINICPPFVLAFGAASSFEDVLKSILFFIIFFLATSVFFLPLLFSNFVARIKLINKIAKIASIIAGVYFVGMAVHTILLLYGIIEIIY